MDTQAKMLFTVPCMAKRTIVSTPPVPMTDEALELIANRFRVLGEPSRLKLIRALEAGEKSVTDLMNATGLTQANSSRHLQTLTHAGILGRRKEGLNVIYFIADPGIFELCHHVCGSLQQHVARHAKAFTPDL
jgi:DNA-binding transcriptional ArsR family regulator